MRCKYQQTMGSTLVSKRCRISAIHSISSIWSKHLQVQRVANSQRVHLLHRDLRSLLPGAKADAGHRGGVCATGGGELGRGGWGGWGGGVGWGGVVCVCVWVFGELKDEPHICLFFFGVGVLFGVLCLPSFIYLVLPPKPARARSGNLRKVSHQDTRHAYNTQNLVVPGHPLSFLAF